VISSCADLAMNVFEQNLGGIVLFAVIQTQPSSPRTKHTDHWPNRLSTLVAIKATQYQGSVLIQS
jgi:hypothetical protein